MMEHIRHKVILVPLVIRTQKGPTDTVVGLEYFRIPSSVLKKLPYFNIPFCELNRKTSFFSYGRNFVF